jgi:hypothetical protein
VGVADDGAATTYIQMEIVLLGENQDSLPILVTETVTFIVSASGFQYDNAAARVIIFCNLVGVTMGNCLVSEGSTRGAMLQV